MLRAGKESARQGADLPTPGQLCVGLQAGDHLVQGLLLQAVHGGREGRAAIAEAQQLKRQHLCMPSEREPPCTQLKDTLRRHPPARPPAHPLLPQDGLGNGARAGSSLILLSREMDNMKQSWHGSASAQRRLLLTLEVSHCLIACSMIPVCSCRNRRRETRSLCNRNCAMHRQGQWVQRKHLRHAEGST